MLVEFGYTYLQNPSKIHYLIQKGKKKNKRLATAWTIMYKQYSAFSVYKYNVYV